MTTAITKNCLINVAKVNHTHTQINKYYLIKVYCLKKKKIGTKQLSVRSLYLELKYPIHHAIG